MSTFTESMDPPNRNFGRNLLHEYPSVESAEGIYYTVDGRKILDASSGAAVSCIGHGNTRVRKAMIDHIDLGHTYVPSSFYRTEIVQRLCDELVRGTEGKMASAFLTGSGSDATEAAMKLSRQYYHEKKEFSRVNFIARQGSYHGNTMGALSLSQYAVRRQPYEEILMKNIYHVSSCNPYHQREKDQSDEDFIRRKVLELETKFQQLGPNTVIAFIAEPIVGAALGCVPAVSGYLKAMKEVCQKHGALFILDEIMCGMGRTGTLHAWQAEDVVPDIQTVGKGLAAGYQQASALLISQEITDILRDGSGQFVHGLTYDSMPLQAVAALEVQRIIQEDHLLNNVVIQGDYLKEKLTSLLGNHPNVGNIRGRGLFWGIEFVKNKVTKEPFDPNIQLALKMKETALLPPFNIMIYPCGGNNDGFHADCIMLAPPFIVTRENIDDIVVKVYGLICKTFQDLVI